MPPKRRKNAESKQPDDATEKPPAPAQRQKLSLPDELVNEKKKKSKVKWSPVFRRLGYFALIIFIPTVLNYAALKQETRALVDKGGQLYDVGWGQKLFMHCMGEGLPTVLLEAPIGHSSETWCLVQPLIAKRTKVCVYDRAGMGLSDRAYLNTSEYANDFSEAAKERDRTQPSTVERMVEDLHRLVSYASNQPKPLLLVSSDFSTFISRFYTQLYGHEVAGLVLIDPAFESLFDSDNAHDNKWADYWYNHTLSHMRAVHLSASLGLNRLALMVGLMPPVEDPELNRILPEDIITRKKHLLCQPKHLTSAFDEYYFINESMSQLKTMFRVKPFPGYIPVTIATYKRRNRHLSHELTKAWSEGSNKLMRNVHTGSKRVQLPGADYLMFYQNPQSVTSVVVAMVEAWRRDSSMAA